MHIFAWIIASINVLGMFLLIKAFQSDTEELEDARIIDKYNLCWGDKILPFLFITLSEVFFILYLINRPNMLIACILAIWAIYWVIRSCRLWAQYWERSAWTIGILAGISGIFVWKYLGWFPGFRGTISSYFYNLPPTIRGVLLGALIGWGTNYIAIQMIVWVVIPKKKEKMARGIGNIVKKYIGIPIVNEIARWIAEDKVRNENIGETIRNVLPILKAEIWLVEVFGGILGGLVGYIMVHSTWLK